MTGLTRLLGVAPVGKGDWSRPGGTGSHPDLEPSGEGVGQPGWLVTLVASGAGPDLVMTDRAAAGRLEGEGFPGSGQMALQACHLHVAAVGKAVLSRGGGWLQPGEKASREQPDQGGPNEQAPGGVRQPGPAIGRSEVVHGGRRESTSQPTRSAPRAPDRPTA